MNRRAEKTRITKDVEGNTVRSGIELVADPVK